MTNNTTLLFRTQQFSFTNTELLFIKRYISKKYPLVMSEFIDKARLFMKELQQRSPQKFMYDANLYYPDNGQRYVVSESLYLEDAQLGTTISIQPTSASERDEFIKFKQEHPDGMLKNAFSILNDFQTQDQEKYKTAFTLNGLPVSFVIPKLLGFIESVKHESLIKNCTVHFNENGTISFMLDIGHRESLSHYVSVTIIFATMVNKE